MIKEIICENTSVDLAVFEALKILNVTHSDVEITVIRQATKGFLGVGKQLAKVCVAVKETDNSMTNESPNQEKEATSTQLPTEESTITRQQDVVITENEKNVQVASVLEKSVCAEIVPAEESKSSRERIVDKSNFIFENLNESQIQAITTTEGYIRVIAGAGSGKTKALTHRYVYLVEELGVMPANILCVTFTNKAANEMKQRIRKMIGDVDLGKISTFHGFCVQLLREDCHVVQYPARFVILDEEDVDGVLKECFETLGITSRDYTFKQAKGNICFQKNMTPYVELLCDPTMEQLSSKRKQAQSIADKVFFEYLYVQRKTFGLDFDDLIIFALHILSVDEEVRVKWQKRLQYIMVDEFQDVSKKQYELVKILSDYHKNLFIVGDPDQTIYSWRGANVWYILNFDKVFAGAQTILMNTNYRSMPEVIKTSNTLIAKNKNRIEKALMPARQGHGSTVYFHGKTQSDEATWIANQIMHLSEQGVKLSEIAILYRAHYVSRPIEEQLVQNQIAYILYSGIAFYRRKEIKDILCYFRMIVAADDIAFLRVINEPKRGVGKKRIALLKEYAELNNCSLYDALKENSSHSLLIKTRASNFVETIEYLKQIYQTSTISNLLNEVLNRTQYEELLRTSGDEERLDNIAELKKAIYDFEVTAGEDITLEDYLDHISLFTNMDKDEKKDSVKMMTVHTAKGLEFRFVFVCALSEGIFPSKKTDTKEKLEEERRLAYVAFTRAEDKLFLSDAEGVNYDGSFRYPSRFIFNCEKVNLEYVVELPENLIDDAQLEINYSEQMFENIANLKVGDKISHPVLGNGEIMEISTEKSCYIIRFDDLDTTRNMSFRVKLEKV